jgi:hypothetical protein
MDAGRTPIQRAQKIKELDFSLTVLRAAKEECLTIYRFFTNGTLGRQREP